MRLRAAVDKAASNREQYVDKFCNNLDRDITELGKEVKEIKNQAQVHAQYILNLITLILRNYSYFVNPRKLYYSLSCLILKFILFCLKE